MPRQPATGGSLAAGVLPSIGVVAPLRRRRARPRSKQLEQIRGQAKAGPLGRPAQRASLQAQPCKAGAVLRGAPRVFWLTDTGPATPFAAVIWLAGVPVPLALIPP